MMLGTCIGLGNYRWFLLLVASLTIFSSLTFWLIKYQLGDIVSWDGEISVEEILTNNFILFFLLFISFIGIIAFGLLTIYHFFITSHNLTTNEHIKKYYKVNPFDCGEKFRNWYHCIVCPDKLLPPVASGDQTSNLPIEASYKELASTNSECVSDFYDY
jgi:palmitoyltransferase ZDHHC9/14/18